MKWKIKEQLFKIIELMSERVGVLIHVCMLQYRFCVPMNPVPQSSNSGTSQKRDMNSSKTKFFVLCFCVIKRWKRGSFLLLLQSLQKVINLFLEQTQRHPLNYQGWNSFIPLSPWARAIACVGRRQLEDQRQLPCSVHSLRPHALLWSPGEGQVPHIHKQTECSFMGWYPLEWY